MFLVFGVLSTSRLSPLWFIKPCPHRRDNPRLERLGYAFCSELRLQLLLDFCLALRRHLAERAVDRRLVGFAHRLL